MPDVSGLYFWIRLLQRKLKFVFGVTLMAGVLTLGVVFLLPRWYEAHTSILPPHESTRPLSRDGIATALRVSNQIPFSEGVTLAEIYMAILESETVARRLIERFDLQKHYGTSTMVETIRTLRSHSRVVPTLRRVIEVRVEDKDPERTADLANAYIQELDLLFRETRSSTGRRQRVFLEQRIGGARADLDSAEAALALVQATEGMTALSGDMAEAAEAAGNLLGQRMALSIQLQIMDEIGVESSPARAHLELELAAVEKEISRLPVAGLAVARRLRNLRMQEVLFAELNQQLEIARIEEARDTPSVEVLDVAVSPDRHKRPRKGLSAMAGAFAGFLFAVSWSALRENIA